MKKHKEVEVKEKEEKTEPKAPVKTKRDIVRFIAEKPIAINLDHVTSMYIIHKTRIVFEFYTNAQAVDFPDENSASDAFENLLKKWLDEEETEGCHSKQ